MKKYIDIHMDRKALCNDKCTCTILYIIYIYVELGQLGIAPQNIIITLTTCGNQMLLIFRFCNQML